MRSCQPMLVLSYNHAQLKKKNIQTIIQNLHLWFLFSIWKHVCAIKLHQTEFLLLHLPGLFNYINNMCIVRVHIIYASIAILGLITVHLVTLECLMRESRFATSNLSLLSILKQTSPHHLHPFTNRFKPSKPWIFVDLRKPY